MSGCSCCQGNCSPGGGSSASGLKQPPARDGNSSSPAPALGSDATSFNQRIAQATQAAIGGAR